MMAESSMKRRGSSDGGDSTDRLSSLPDSVLCHIMYYLYSTRTVVTTISLLSRRWRYLWKHLQVIHFDLRFRNKEQFKRIQVFVNTLLTLRRSTHILKFCLLIHRAYGYDDTIQAVRECVLNWILHAVGPHLQELVLDIHTTCRCVITLPPSLFINCINLHTLLLEGNIELEVKHSSVYFPSLKYLDLNKVRVDSVVVFLSGSPKLEYLHICFYPKEISLTNVPVPSSSSAKSTNHNFTWSYFQAAHTDETLGIIGNFHSMVEAFIDVFPSCESELVDSFLDGLDGTLLCLELSHSTSKQCPLQGPALNYPEFRRLNHLKFVLPCFNSNLLVDVLQKCHMLKVFIIQSNKEEPSPLRTWEPQSIAVPKCLSRLNYICIEGYQGFEDELTFAEYILRNGRVLETMLIFVDTTMDLTNKYCSVKRLTDIPRGSVKCQLKFDPVVSS